MNFRPDGTILAASHDAGGAEVLSSWIRRRSDLRFCHLLEGPAVNVFRRKLGEIPILSRQQFLEGSPPFDAVLTGTSWGSDLEKIAIRYAKQHRIACASYLDHWSGYAERFLLDGKSLLPDELWAGDTHAFRLLNDLFPDGKTVLVPNPYFEDMVSEIKAIPPPPKPDGPIRILYLAEPVSAVTALKYGNPNYYGYTEFEALEGYLAHLREQPEKIEKIRIRRHPAEPHGKYRQIAAKFSPHFEIETDLPTTLAKDCAWANRAVGCDSMAMVVALLAGRAVDSCIPKGGAEMILPYPEIRKLFR